MTCKPLFALLLPLLAADLPAQDFASWAKTPPMGWNSWDCFGPTVTEQEVKANADYMARYLRKAGWQYIVVDIRWYVENDKAHGYNEANPAFSMDGYGRFIPSVNRFPSSAGGKGFKPLADYVHRLGLKFGIHIMRGVPKAAVEKKTPVLGTTHTAADIASTSNLCQWLHDMYTVDAARAGAREYYNSLFRLYASWGVDFVKVDDIASPYHREEIELVRKAIDGCGRPIVLSLSPGPAPLADAPHLQTHANMWRIVGDFWDNWPQLEEHFSLFAKWAPQALPGRWPDGDMLPLGRIGIRAEVGDARNTKFTPDEQITLMSLFAVCRSPLMLGGNLPDNDRFTQDLITNEEVLSVLQKSTNNRLLSDDGERVLWTADGPGRGTKYVALFYADRRPLREEKAIGKSRLLTPVPGNQSDTVTVSLDGARKLYLVVTPGNDGADWDHADWIEPKLIRTRDTLRLTGNTWVSATSGWAFPRVGMSVGGNPLTVNENVYRDGIGTHAASVIEYDLPEGCRTFSSIVGLDKECVGHTEGATVRFLVFTGDPKGSPTRDSIRVSLNLGQLNLSGACSVRDLWAKKDLGTFTGEVPLDVRNHGARLLKIGDAGLRQSR